jgi:hypothetical protein
VWLQVVRKLKHFWATGPGSHHWLKSMLLNTETVKNPDGGWLDTGDDEFIEAQ